MSLLSSFSASDAADDARRRAETTTSESTLQLVARLERELSALPPPDPTAVAGQAESRDLVERRRRIEERGTRDFPSAQGRRLYGELTVNMTIDARGRLVDAQVIDASGSPSLDRQALAIVRAASPFGPFSARMRRQADEIVVTSRFRFSHGDGVEATVGTV